MSLLVKTKTKKAYCISAAARLGVEGPGIMKMRTGRAKKSNFLDRDFISFLAAGLKLTIFHLWT